MLLETPSLQRFCEFGQTRVFSIHRYDCTRSLRLNPDDIAVFRHDKTSVLAPSDPSVVQVCSNRSTRYDLTAGWPFAYVVRSSSRRRPSTGFH